MAKNTWEGERVRLRAVEPGDWQHFMEWARDEEASRLGWQVNLPQGSEAVKKAAEEQSARQDRNDDNMRFVITTLRGVAVGSIDTHHADRLNRRFEYGISLAREHWGQGFATDALEILFRHYFGELGYHKVNAWVYAFNDRSIAFHERLGMIREGTARQTHFTRGEFHDEHLYGMTAGEFWDRYGR